MNELQADILDRFGGDSTGWGDRVARLYNRTVCETTGRSPTVVQDMTKAECEAVLAALDAVQEAKVEQARQAERAREQAREAQEEAKRNETLRQSGRYGFLMADD